MPNKITRLARDLLSIEEDVTYRLDYSKKQKPYLDDFNIHIFEQTWSDTACGLGGPGIIAGQAFTTAYTVVLVPTHMDQKCFVYFDGKFAYSSEFTDKFRKDLLNCVMLPVSRASEYKQVE